MSRPSALMRPTCPEGSCAQIQALRDRMSSNLRFSLKVTFNFGSHDLRSEGQFCRMPGARASNLRAHEVLQGPPSLHKSPLDSLREEAR